jgi:ARC105/Med15 mediator subunit C-terminal domain
VNFISVEQFCCDVDNDNASHATPAQNVLRGLDNLRVSTIGGGHSFSASSASAHGGVSAASSTLPPYPSHSAANGDHHHPLREQCTGVLQPHNVADYLAQSLAAMPEVSVARLRRDPFEAQLCMRSQDTLLTATVRLERSAGAALLLDPGVPPLFLPPCGDNPHPVLRPVTHLAHAHTHTRARIYAAAADVDHTLQRYARRLAFVAHLSDELYRLEVHGYRFSAQPDSLRSLLLLDHDNTAVLLLRCTLSGLPAAPPLQLRVPLKYPRRSPSASLARGLSPQLSARFAALLRRDSLHRSLSTLLRCYRDAVRVEFEPPT